MEPAPRGCFRGGRAAASSSSLHFPHGREVLAQPGGRHLSQPGDAQPTSERSFLVLQGQPAERSRLGLRFSPGPGPLIAIDLDLAQGQTIRGVFWEYSRCDRARLSRTVRRLEGVEHLQELALDLFWSWNHSADELWGQIDAGLWSLTHNPWVVLQTVSRKKLAQLCADSAFCKGIEDLIERRRLQFEGPAWFQQAHPDAQLGAVAYFSLEFMLSEALPITGGLGNVAGDQLKAASDMGIPVVGVGLLYQQGYFRQILDPDGSARAVPLQRSDAAAGHPAARGRGVAAPGGRAAGRRVGYVRVWQAVVGASRPISSTPTTPPTSRSTAVSPTRCTAADRRCGWLRRSCWASAACGR